MCKLLKLVTFLLFINNILCDGILAERNLNDLFGNNINHNTLVDVEGTTTYYRNSGSHRNGDGVNSDDGRGDDIIIDNIQSIASTANNVVTSLNTTWKINDDSTNDENDIHYNGDQIGVIMKMGNVAETRIKRMLETLPHNDPTLSIYSPASYSLRHYDSTNKVKRCRNRPIEIRHHPQRHWVPNENLQEIHHQYTPSEKFLDRTRNNQLHWDQNYVFRKPRQQLTNCHCNCTLTNRNHNNEFNNRNYKKCKCCNEHVLNIDRVTAEGLRHNAQLRKNNVNSRSLVQPTTIQNEREIFMTTENMNNLNNNIQLTPFVSTKEFRNNLDNEGQPPPTLDFDRSTTELNPTTSINFQSRDLKRQAPFQRFLTKPNSYRDTEFQSNQFRTTSQTTENLISDDTTTFNPSFSQFYTHNKQSKIQNFKKPVYILQQPAKNPKEMDIFTTNSMPTDNIESLTYFNQRKPTIPAELSTENSFKSDENSDEDDETALILHRDVASYEAKEEPFNISNPKPLSNYLHFFNGPATESSEISSTHESDEIISSLSYSTTQKTPKEDELMPLLTLKQKPKLEKIIVLDQLKPYKQKNSEGNVILIDKANVVLEQPQEEPLDLDLVIKKNGFNFDDESDENVAESQDNFVTAYPSDTNNFVDLTENYALSPADIKSIQHINEKGIQRNKMSTQISRPELLRNNPATKESSTVEDFIKFVESKTNKKHFATQFNSETIKHLWNSLAQRKEHETYLQNLRNKQTRLYSKPIDNNRFRYPVHLQPDITTTNNIYPTPTEDIHLELENSESHLSKHSSKSELSTYRSLNANSNGYTNTNLATTSNIASNKNHQNLQRYSEIHSVSTKENLEENAAQILSTSTNPNLSTISKNNNNKSYTNRNLIKIEQSNKNKLITYSNQLSKNLKKHNYKLLNENTETIPTLLPKYNEKQVIDVLKRDKNIVVTNNYLQSTTKINSIVPDSKTTGASNLDMNNYQTSLTTPIEIHQEIIDPNNPFNMDTNLNSISERPEQQTNINYSQVNIEMNQENSKTVHLEKNINSSQVKNILSEEITRKSDQQDQKPNSNQRNYRSSHETSLESDQLDMVSESSEIFSAFTEKDKKPIKLTISPEKDDSSDSTSDYTWEYYSTSEETSDLTTESNQVDSINKSERLSKNMNGRSHYNAIPNQNVGKSNKQTSPNNLSETSNFQIKKEFNKIADKNYLTETFSTTNDLNINENKGIVQDVISVRSKTDTGSQFETTSKSIKHLKDNDKFEGNGISTQIKPTISLIYDEGKNSEAIMSSSNNDLLTKPISTPKDSEDSSTYTYEYYSLESSSLEESQSNESIEVRSNELMPSISETFDRLTEQIKSPLTNDSNESPETVFCICHKYINGKLIPINNGEPFTPNFTLPEQNLEELNNYYSTIIEKLREENSESLNIEDIDEITSRKIDNLINEQINKHLAKYMCPNCLRTDLNNNYQHDQSEQYTIEFIDPPIDDVNKLQNKSIFNAKNQIASVKSHSNNEPLNFKLMDNEYMYTDEYTYEYVSEESPEDLLKDTEGITKLEFQNFPDSSKFEEEILKSKSNKESTNVNQVGRRSSYEIVSDSKVEVKLPTTGNPHLQGNEQSNNIQPEYSWEYYDSTSEETSLPNPETKDTVYDQVTPVTVSEISSILPENENNSDLFIKKLVFKKPDEETYNSVAVENIHNPILSAINYGISHHKLINPEQTTDIQTIKYDDLIQQSTENNPTTYNSIPSEISSHNPILQALNYNFQHMLDPIEITYKQPKKYVDEDISSLSDEDDSDDLQKETNDQILTLSKKNNLEDETTFSNANNVIKDSTKMDLETESTEIIEILGKYAVRVPKNISQQIQIIPVSSTSEKTATENSKPKLYELRFSSTIEPKTTSEDGKYEQNIEKKLSEIKIPSVNEEVSANVERLKPEQMEKTSNTKSLTESHLDQNKEGNLETKLLPTISETVFKVTEQPNRKFNSITTTSSNSPNLILTRENDNTYESYETEEDHEFLNSNTLSEKENEILNDMKVESSERIQIVDKSMNYNSKQYNNWKQIKILTPKLQQNEAVFQNWKENNENVQESESLYNSNEKSQVQSISNENLNLIEHSNDIPTDKAEFLNEANINNNFAESISNNPIISINSDLIDKTRRPEENENQWKTDKNDKNESILISPVNQNKQPNYLESSISTRWKNKNNLEIESSERRTQVVDKSVPYNFVTSSNTNPSTETSVPTSINKIIIINANNQEEISVESDSTDEEISTKSDSTNEEISINSDSAGEEINLKSDSTDEEISTKSDSTDEEISAKSGFTDKEINSKSDSTDEEISTKNDSTYEEISINSNSAGEEINLESDSTDEEMSTKSNSTDEEVSTKSDSTDEEISIKRDSTGEEINSKSDSTDKEMSTKSDSTDEEFSTNSDSTDEEISTESDLETESNEQILVIDKSMNLYSDQINKKNIVLSSNSFSPKQSEQIISSTENLLNKHNNSVTVTQTKFLNSDQGFLISNNTDKAIVNQTKEKIELNKLNELNTNNDSILNTQYKHNHTIVDKNDLNIDSTEMINMHIPASEQIQMQNVLTNSFPQNSNDPNQIKMDITESIKNNSFNTDQQMIMTSDYNVGEAKSKQNNIYKNISHSNNLQQYIERNKPENEFPRENFQKSLEEFATLNELEIDNQHNSVERSLHSNTDKDYFEKHINNAINQNVPTFENHEASTASIDKITTLILPNNREEMNVKDTTTNDKESSNTPIHNKDNSVFYSPNIILDDEFQFPTEPQINNHEPSDKLNEQKVTEIDSNKHSEDHLQQRSNYIPNILEHHSANINETEENRNSSEEMSTNSKFETTSEYIMSPDFEIDSSETTINNKNKILRNFHNSKMFNSSTQIEKSQPLMPKIHNDVYFNTDISKQFNRKSTKSENSKSDLNEQNQLKNSQLLNLLLNEELKITPMPEIFNNEENILDDFQMESSDHIEVVDKSQMFNPNIIITTNTNEQNNMLENFENKLNDHESMRSDSISQNISTQEMSLSQSEIHNNYNTVTNVNKQSILAEYMPVKSTEELKNQQKVKTVDETIRHSIENYTENIYLPTKGYEFINKDKHLNQIDRPTSSNYLTNEIGQSLLNLNRTKYLTDMNSTHFSKDINHLSKTLEHQENSTKQFSNLFKDLYSSLNNNYLESNSQLTHKQEQFDNPQFSNLRLQNEKTEMTNHNPYALSHLNANYPELTGNIFSSSESSKKSFSELTNDSPLDQNNQNLDTNHIINKQKTERGSEEHSYSSSNQINSNEFQFKTQPTINIFTRSSTESSYESYTQEYSSAEDSNPFISKLNYKPNFTKHKFVPSDLNQPPVVAFMPAVININSSDIPNHVRQIITEKMIKACQVSANECQQLKENFENNEAYDIISKLQKSYSTESTENSASDESYERSSEYYEEYTTEQSAEENIKPIVITVKPIKRSSGEITDLNNLLPPPYLKTLNSKQTEEPFNIKPMMKSDIKSDQISSNNDSEIVQNITVSTNSNEKPNLISSEVLKPITLPSSSFDNYHNEVETELKKETTTNTFNSEFLRKLSSSTNNIKNLNSLRERSQQIDLNRSINTNENIPDENTSHSIKTCPSHIVTESPQQIHTPIPPMDPHLVTTLRSVFGPNYGKIVPATELPEFKNVNRKLISGQMYFVANNGLKVPLKITRSKEGKLQLTLDVTKICKNHYQPHAQCNCLHDSKSTESSENSYEYETSEYEESRSQNSDSQYYSSEYEENSESEEDRSSSNIQNKIVFYYKNNPLSKTIQEVAQNKNIVKRIPRDLNKIEKDTFFRQFSRIRRQFDTSFSPSTTTEATEPNTVTANLYEDIRPKKKQNYNQDNNYNERPFADFFPKVPRNNIEAQHSDEWKAHKENEKIFNQYQHLKDTVELKDFFQNPHSKNDDPLKKFYSHHHWKENEDHMNENFMHFNHPYQNHFYENLINKENENNNEIKKFPSVDHLTKFDQTIASKNENFRIHLPIPLYDSGSDEKQNALLMKLMSEYENHEIINESHDESEEFYNFILNHLLEQSQKQTEVTKHHHEHRHGHGHGHGHGHHHHRHHHHNNHHKHHSSNEDIEMLKKRLNIYEQIYGSPTVESFPKYNYPNWNVEQNNEKIPIIHPTFLEQYPKCNDHENIKHGYHYEENKKHPIKDDDTFSDEIEIKKLTTSAPPKSSSTEILDERKACDNFVNKRLGLVRSLFNWVRDWITETAVKTKQAITTAATVA